MKNLGHDFDVFKDHLYQVNEEVTAKIKDYYPDLSKIRTYLDGFSAGNNTKITISDVEGNTILSVDRRKSYGLSLELKGFTVVGRNNIYVVEVVYPFSIENLGELNSFTKIRDVALVCLVLLVTLLIIYLHFSLVRPLTMLNRGLETINYRNTGANGDFAMPLKTYKRNDELGDLTRKFREMQQRLESSYRQQTEMIASISHDLKTPLTSILGFLERLLGRKASEERRKEYCRIIYQKAQDINELVTGFNDFVTSDLEGSAAGNKDIVDLREFFDSVYNEYFTELKGKGIELYRYDETGDGEELFLEMDIQRIRRVFANLVGNSLKYADKSGKIVFRCSVRQNYTIFSVEDGGPGVPPEDLTVIFDKFYRVDKSRSRQKGGSGLGLAICKNIVESHGGNIWAYLPPKGGLGVSFSLPLVTGRNS